MRADSGRGRSLIMRVARTIPLGLIFGWFVAQDVRLIGALLEHGAVGGDARLYHAAARAWTMGLDPWAVVDNGIKLGAPPTTLVPYVLMLWLPPNAWIVLAGVAAVIALRALGISVLWLSFPPLFFAVLHGSIEPVVLAALLVGPRWAAVFLKPYTVAIVVLQGRLRSVVFAAIATIVTLLVLPWGFFLEHSEEIPALLSEQSGGGLAARSLALQLATAASLIYLGREHGSWLIIPALWPATNFQYQALALPSAVRLPVIAVAAAVPNEPELFPLAVVLAALVRFAMQRLSDIRAGSPRPRSEPEPTPTAK